MYIAGDIGGTKTLLALYATDAEREPLLERRYASRAYHDFASLLEAFLAEAAQQDIDYRPLASACLGVAGPVIDNRARLTYLPWLMDGAALASRFGIGRAILTNDFAAAATGVATLRAKDLATLQTGETQADGARVALGAGTGLGVAILAPFDGRYRVLAGEGGHVGFAPRNDTDVELWRTLREELGRVTAESVVSGPGLVRVYRHLARSDEPSPEVQAIAAAEDPAAAIARAALDNSDARARASVELFLSCYGAFAGDLALTAMASGGVFLCGGIAPKLLPLLRNSGFLDAFRDKGGHSRLAATIPVHVVLDEKLGLHGAALIAADAAHVRRA
jgi:glucokinase